MLNAPVGINGLTGIFGILEAWFDATKEKYSLNILEIARSFAAVTLFEFISCVFMLFSGFKREFISFKKQQGRKN